MKPYYHISGNSIAFSDYSVKIGDVAKNTVSSDLIEKIQTHAKPTYKDNVMSEHLYDMEALETTQPYLHENELSQLNEILGFINSRKLAYIRFV